jgi:hypothetical protein
MEIVRIFRILRPTEVDMQVRRHAELQVEYL